MDIEKQKEALRGVTVTTATPFTKNLTKIDVQGLEDNLDYLLEQGITCVVPCGNTGEYYSLTEVEWEQVVNTTLSTVGSKMVVMPGVGGSIGTAKKQIQYAEAHGAHMVMVMYPQHVFSSEEGLLNYYREILKTSNDIGVVVYKKGPLLSDSVLVSLASHKRVVGVKYAFGRIVDFARTVQIVGNGIVWSCGTAERFAPFFWLAGARGFTSGLGNFAPKISLRMYDALVKHDFAEAMNLQHMISGLEYLRETRNAANNVPVVKAGLDHVGLAGGDCRPPIHPLGDDERKNVSETIREWPSLS